MPSPKKILEILLFLAMLGALRPTTIFGAEDPRPHTVDIPQHN
jgi:hypothetical protein